MSSRTLLAIGVGIIFIALIAAAGYVMHQHLPGSPSSSAATSSPSNTSYGISPATSTPAASTTAQVFALPVATTTVNTASWPMYVDNDLGYSIEYPPGFLPGVHEGVLTLAVPKNTYFHWPLQDDVKITVAAGPSCPQISRGEPNLPPIAYTLNGRAFTRTIGTDVGAGNRYVEIADDTQAKGTCYHVDFLDHGANGAGFYVDDPSLVQKYDAQHEADLSAVIALLNAMISSLRILASPL